MAKRRSRFAAAPAPPSSVPEFSPDTRKLSSLQGDVRPAAGDYDEAPSRDSSQGASLVDSKESGSGAAFRIAPLKRRLPVSARRRLRGALNNTAGGAFSNPLADADQSHVAGVDSGGPWEAFDTTGSKMTPNDQPSRQAYLTTEKPSSQWDTVKRPRSSFQEVRTGGSEEGDEKPDLLLHARGQASPRQEFAAVDVGSRSMRTNPDGLESDPLDAYMQEVSEDATRSVAEAGRSGLSILTKSVEDKDDDSAQVFPSTDLEGGFLDRSKRKRPVYDRVDHSLIDYAPFTKDLYREVPELARMTPSEIHLARRSLGNIRIRGRKCPAPIRSFGQCGLSAALLAVITNSGFTNPTPIQSQAIPCIMSGRDVIGVAKTGSGKTLAFLLPVLRHVAIQKRPAAGEGPAAMLVAPTRELAIQIYGEARRFGRVVNLRCVCAYGGSGLKDQISDLKRGADIVVCTPGRMIDLLAMNSGRITNLRRVTIVVLDEADRMFDMGFEPQLTRLVENVRPDRQTVMFSATFPPQVEKLARKILSKPIEIVVGGNSVAATSIDQHVEVRSEESKFFRLLQLLGEWYEKGSTLVFVDRQDNADRIFRELSQAGYLCLSLHGGMDQADRDSAIADFKNGDVRVLIATSVAARGLDVKKLTLVVNFDVPNHYEDYVHRVGRTGRAGRRGTSYTFLTPEQDMFAGDMVKALELSAKSSVDREGLSKEEVERKVEDAVNSAVPEELRDLAKTYTVKQELKRKAGIAVRGSNSGYGGRGFTFEENEESAQASLRKSLAKRLKKEAEADGEGSGAESEAGEGNVSNRDPSLEIKVVRRSSKAVIPPTDSSHKTEPARVVDPDVALQASIRAAEKAALDAAQREGLDDVATASRVVVARTNVLVAHRSRNVRPQSGERPVDGKGIETQAQDVSRDGKVPNTAAALSAAAAAAAALSARISGPHGPEIDGRGTRHVSSAMNEAVPESTAPEEDSVFEAELEINDYPQHARWRVTHASALDDVTDNTGCVATTRGNFYPAGRNPPAGERKLHLLIEGPSEIAVRSAFKEIRLRLEEAAAARPDERGGAYSKYSVV